MAQATAVFIQLAAAIGGIRDVIEVGHACGTDQRQGNRGTAIVHRRRRQQGRDRHATIGGIDVQLEAMPTDIVAMGLTLRAAVTIRGDLGHYLRQRLRTLPLDGRLLGGSTFLATPGPSPSLCRRRRDRRRSARSTARRSIKSTVASSPSPVLATKAFASQAHSCGWWPTPHHPGPVNSSTRTHSRTWITFSSFGVSVPTSSLSSEIYSC